MHPSFERWHSNCLNLTIQCGIATKVSGLGITSCIHSQGYFCTTRKGNHIRVALLAISPFSAKELFAAEVPQYSGVAQDTGKFSCLIWMAEHWKKAFAAFVWPWPATLAATPLSMVSRHGDACGCTGPELALSPSGRPWEKWGLLERMWPKDSGTHLKC